MTKRTHFDGHPELALVPIPPRRKGSKGAVDPLIWEATQKKMLNITKRTHLLAVADLP